MKQSKKKLKPKTKKKLTEKQKSKNLKINSKLSNLYRGRKKLINELDEYIFINPNKKISIKLGVKNSAEKIRKVSTIQNFLSDKIRNLNTKIGGLKRSKVSLKKIKNKIEIKKDQNITGLLNVFAFSSWDKKQIFLYINNKNIKNIINLDTGELFLKKTQQTDLIKEISTILLLMESDDIFKIYIYKTVIEFKSIKNGLKK